MEKNKVNAIVTQYKDAIPENRVLQLKNALLNASDSVYENLTEINVKSSTVTLLLSIFLGGLGVDRFYIGDTGTGVAKLLFGWLTLGIWPLCDVFVCYKKVKEKNFNKLMLAIM